MVVNVIYQAFYHFVVCSILVGDCYNVLHIKVWALGLQLKLSKGLAMERLSATTAI